VNSSNDPWCSIIKEAEAVPDYKLELLRISDDLLKPLDGITTPAIRGVADAFTGNVRQTASLCGLVQGLYFWGSMVGMHRAIAWESVMGRKYDPEALPDENDSKRIFKVSHDMTAKALATYKSHGDHEERIWRESNDNIKELQSNSDKWLTDGIRSILSGIVVGSWTTFESLAADLWVAAVNCRPRLGLLALDAVADENETGLAAYKKMSKALTITAQLLADNDYNLKGKMGDVCRREFDFSKRGSARNAWLKVFRGHQDKLKQIFLDDDLQRLAESRHAIVHANGRVRSEVLEEVPSLGTMIEDGKISLDGGCVIG
jgi:hypothetical protein